jgi:Kef-type K+ transport system membrane component KefB
VSNFSPELGYVALLFALFVVPRALQRFGLPAAITSVLLGAGAGMGLGWFEHDTTIHLLSAFGIVALFLFAGLDVDAQELRGNAGILLQHLAVRAGLLFAVAFSVAAVLNMDARAATLLALALLTPSTGFILDSIDNLDLDGPEKRWIKTKAIASELLALVVLFATLQSTTAQRMGISILLLTGMIVLLPIVFRAFAALVVPFAPRSEFAFLLMTAVLAAFLTRELGVYYLVGAFVVGMAAQRFRERLPAIASEQLIHAVEMFASFFIPFYFFSAGLQLRREDLSLEALGYGLGFLIVMLPVRIAAVAVHRRVALGERYRVGARIAVALVPTLVFGLVIAQILRERFGVTPAVFGGVIIYTLVTTIVPAFVFKRRLPDYEEPRAPELEFASVAAGATAPGTARPDPNDPISDAGEPDER